MHKRHSGILLHITSLPSRSGIGDMGPAARSFVDFAASSNQKYWQILPVNPTDGINGNSPYSCSSAFAGNELFISPELMAEEGFLSRSDLGTASKVSDKRVEYDHVRTLKQKFFNSAYKRFHKHSGHLKDFERFTQTHGYWLEDFALYTLIKSRHAGRGWQEWPAPLKTRQPKALREIQVKYASDVERIKLIQFLFFRQWEALKEYANSRGVAIIGDIPIYVNYDSVEVWCHPEYFKVDGRGNLRFISGCPPDYFSRIGQRWGNPVYNWANLKKAKYDWWMKRIEHNLKLFDYLRIDHFRGFAGFWQIPAHEKLAVFGHWVKGPGASFFAQLSKEFRPLPIIAEDLGEITPDVTALMKKFAFPGMRVLLFAFGGDPGTNPHVPANYPAHCVAYTGTHDNNTIQGWFHHEAKPHEKANIARVLQARFTPRNIHWIMIEALMRSRAESVIVPLQDYLGLGEEGRMNTPATKIDNWQWRMRANALNTALGRKIGHLVKSTNRG